MGSHILEPLLIDTDVLIDHIRNGDVVIPYDDFQPLLCSAITVSELYSGNSDEMEIIETLLSPFQEIAVNSQISRLGGTIRRQLKLGIADCLIAATALSLNATLLTRNQRHFQLVEGLRLA